MDELRQLARQALSVMIFDLRYTAAPRHGHDSMRHQLLWIWCEEALGFNFEPEVQRLVAVMDSPNVIGDGLRVKLVETL